MGYIIWKLIGLARIWLGFGRLREIDYIIWKSGLSVSILWFLIEPDSSVWGQTKIIFRRFIRKRTDFFENGSILSKHGPRSDQDWTNGVQGLDHTKKSYSKVTPVRENGNWADTNRSSFRTSVTGSLQLSVSPTNCPIITINGIWQSRLMWSPKMIMSCKIKWQTPGPSPSKPFFASATRTVLSTTGPL